jgi:hypothetical protein
LVGETAGTKVDATVVEKVATKVFVWAVQSADLLADEKADKKEL